MQGLGGPRGQPRHVRNAANALSSPPGAAPQHLDPVMKGTGRPGAGSPAQSDAHGPGRHSEVRKQLRAPRAWVLPLQSRRERPFPEITSPQGTAYSHKHTQNLILLVKD